VSELATAPSAEAQAYTASLLAVLGSRDPFEVMRSNPAMLRAGIEGLSATQLAEREAPGKWSIAQLVQHLDHSEIVGAFRFRMVLAHDRPVIPGYDQELWADRIPPASDDPSDAVADALDRIALLRAANLRMLERLSPEQLARVGLHAERGEESLAHMVRMYAGHDLVHQRQLLRIRAAVTGVGMAR
jgi:hypothetical protein